MPESHFPTRMQSWIRGLYVIAYLFVMWNCVTTLRINELSTLAVVGPEMARFISAVTAISALMAAVSAATHQWLIERAALPWVMTGMALYWFVVFDPIDGAALSLLGVRMFQLEVVAHRQYRCRGHRFGRHSARGRRKKTT